MTARLVKGFLLPHLRWEYGVRGDVDALRVPCRNPDGSVYRWAYIGVDGQRWLGSSKPLEPFGRETLSLGGPVAFAVEGWSCCFATRAAFSSTPVLGIPGAYSWRSEWARYFAPFDVVYFGFDNDTAGRRLLANAWADIRSPKGRRLKFPEGMDARDVLQLGGGTAEFERLIRDADYTAGALEYVLSYLDRKDGSRRV